MTTCVASADTAVPITSSQSFFIGSEVHRIGLTDDSKLWQELPCHQRPLPNATAVFPNRQVWREPPVDELCCVRSGCFRAVLDGHVKLNAQSYRVGQKVRVRNYAAKRPANKPGWELGRVTSLNPLRVRSTSAYPPIGKAYDEVRPWEQRDDDEELALIEQVRKLLVAKARLRDEEIVVSTWRRQTLSYSESFLAANAFHFDYGQNPGAAFSATLYSGHDGEDDLVGGWTAFVTSSPPKAKPEEPQVGQDEAAGSPEADVSIGLQRLTNGSVLLSRGLAVAPRIGRLLLFSGGAENYHAPLPVGQGRRQSLQVFFGCRCAPT